MFPDTPVAHAGNSKVRMCSEVEIGCIYNYINMKITRVNRKWTNRCRPQRIIPKIQPVIPDNLFVFSNNTESSVTNVTERVTMEKIIKPNRLQFKKKPSPVF